jgi:hypothetical protein
MEATMAEELQPAPGVKYIYLIKRKPTTSREEICVHWFANHMPIVIKGQQEAAARGKRHASRYIATLFDQDYHGNYPWDGMAQLWWDATLRAPDVPMGTTPTDTFQQKAEPYVPWGTTEYVVMDGELPVIPLTMNDPFPTTRSNFHKISFLVSVRQGTDYDAFFTHWLETHIPNVRSTMLKVGGFRYCVSHSLNPESEPYAGLAEIYFPDVTGWQEYQNSIKPDGMEEWIDMKSTHILSAGTEMVGIA